MHKSRDYGVFDSNYDHDLKLFSKSRSWLQSRTITQFTKLDIIDILETDTELFETLLCSYSSRLRAVKNANGRHTDY